MTTVGLDGNRARIAVLQTPDGHGRLDGVATYEDVYRLTYVRGPSGILVMLAEDLRTG